MTERAREVKKNRAKNERRKSNLDEVLTRILPLKLYFQILIEIKLRLYKLWYLLRLDL